MGHSFSPLTVNTIKRAMSMRSLVTAQAWSCASVSFVISLFRPFVAASDSRSACVADSPISGGAAHRAQHQIDFT